MQQATSPQRAFARVASFSLLVLLSIDSWRAQPFASAWAWVPGVGSHSAAAGTTRQHARPPRAPGLKASLSQVPETGVPHRGLIAGLSPSAPWIRGAYVFVCLALLLSPRRTWVEAFARSATVAVALADFAPTAAQQITESAAALRCSAGTAGTRWAVLVRLKVLGEFLGLAMMCYRGWRTCVGASVVLASHTLFWLAGAAAARVDACARPAPLPRHVARVILIADAVVCGAAVAGWAAPAHWARCAGAAAYAAAVSCVSLEKFSGRMSAQRSG